MTASKAKSVFMIYNADAGEFWDDQYSTLQKAKDDVESHGCDDTEYIIFEAKEVALSCGVTRTRKWVAK